MAKPTVAWRATVAATTAGPTYTASPDWTPAANSLIVAFCVGCSASPTDPTDVTAHGVTLTKLTLSAATLSTTHICSIWVGDAGASPTNAAAAATWGGTPTGGAVLEFEITDWNNAEIVDNAFGKASLIETATAATGTTGTVTLNLRPDVTSEHVEMSFWLHLANQATTPRVNWTETAGADGNFNNPATGVEGQFRTDAYELTASATWTTSINWRGYALTVRGTATTPIETLKISDTVSARLNPQPILLGSETVKVSDAVTADIPLVVVVASENLKLSDVGKGVAQLIGVIHIQDTIFAEMSAASNDLSVEVGAENLKLSETVQADENPRPVLVAQEVLKLADTVTVALQLAVAVADEVLHVQDAVTADENPRPVLVAQEVLKLADTLTVALQLAVAVADESLKIADSVFADENPRDVSAGTEILKLADTLTVARDLTASLQEDLKVQDSVSADENPRPVLVAQEVLKLADVLTATMDLVASQTETLKLADTVTADENPRDLAVTTEVLKLADEVFAAINLAAALADENLRLADTVFADENPRPVSVAQETLFLADTLAVIRDLSASMQEDVKVQDTVAADENPRDVSAGTENLKLADTLTAVLDPLQTALADELLHVQDTVTVDLIRDLSVTVATESIRVMDFVFGAARFVASQNTRTAGLMENPLKLADTPTVALQLAVAVADELLHVQDSVTADENPRPVLVAQESLRVADAVFATLDPEETSRTETVKIADTVATLLNPEQASVEELLHVQDAVTTSLNPLRAEPADELLHVQDEIFAEGGLTPISRTETLKLSDTVSVTLDPLNAAVGEDVHVQDQTDQALDQLATAGELLKLADQLFATLDPLQASASESCRVDDSDFIADLGGIRATLAEAVRISDAVDAAMELVVEATETLRLQDIVYISGIPLTALAFSDERISGEVFTEESLSGDVFTTETLSGEVFTEEELEPA